ncbi:hypothetical protein MBLNU230_g4573t1 [Neophaeotheca triangularis]
MDLLALPPVLRLALYTRRPLLQHYRTLTTDGFQRELQHDPHMPNASDSINSTFKAASPALLTLMPATLNLYNTSSVPSNTQLRYSSRFFKSSKPRILFSAATFRDSPIASPHPEVAFLGRSNVGKSSLLNALFGLSNEKMAHVSKQPGKTRTMNGYGLMGKGHWGAAPMSGEKVAAWKRMGRGGCIVVDMPGYGGGSREEWGTEILKYLENRKQLRRTFVLVDAEHGLKRSDVSLLTHLRQRGIAHTVLLSKADKLLYSGPKEPSPRKLSNGLLSLREVCSGVKQTLDGEAEAQGGRGGLGDILCCSAEKSLEVRGRKEKLGVDEIRWAVLSACGLECDDQGHLRSAEAPFVQQDDDSE